MTTPMQMNTTARLEMQALCVIAERARDLVNGTGTMTALKQAVDAYEARRPKTETKAVAARRRR